MANNFEDRFGRAKITGPRGCLYGPGLIAMALIGGGIFAMSNWETLSGFGRAGAVVVVVLGTLILLPVVLMLCVKFYVDRMFNRLMQRGNTIIDANPTITVEERMPTDDVIDAIGPGDGERREKPQM